MGGRSGVAPLWVSGVRSPAPNSEATSPSPAFPPHSMLGATSSSRIVLPPTLLWAVPTLLTGNEHVPLGRAGAPGFKQEGWVTPERHFCVLDSVSPYPASPTRVSGALSPLPAWAAAPIFFPTSLQSPYSHASPLPALGPSPSGLCSGSALCPPGPCLRACLP